MREVYVALGVLAAAAVFTYLVFYGRWFLGYGSNDMGFTTDAGEITATTSASTTTIETKEEPWPGGSFTIVVLPDTQKYSESRPEIFANQTRWVAGERAGGNIVFVAHLGDIVDHAESDLEWGRANKSMSVLDGAVPYGLSPGNHDTPTGLYNKYFPSSRYKNYVWYGGSYGGNDNSYQLFSAGGDDYVIIQTEFCPRSEVIAWANRVLQDNAGRRAIVVTHGYVDREGRRSVPFCQTQYIWDDLIAPNKNVFMVLCGHVHAEALSVDRVDNRTVYQILSDYQDFENGGNGWLRVMEFVPSEDKIYVRTYSPYLNQYKRDSESSFALDYDMTGAGK